MVRAASAAFESAWAEIAGRFSADTHDEARERLASLIISAAREDSIDADVLRRVGLAAMARAYPHHFAMSPLDEVSGTEN